MLTCTPSLVSWFALLSKCDQPRVASRGKAKESEKRPRGLAHVTHTLPLSDFGEVARHLSVIPAQQGPQPTPREFTGPVMGTLHHPTDRNTCDRSGLGQLDIKRMLTTCDGAVFINGAAILSVQEHAVPAS